MLKDLLIIEDKEELIISQKEKYFHVGYLIPISFAVFFTALFAFAISITFGRITWGLSIVTLLMGLLYRNKDLILSRKSIVIKKEGDLILIEDKETEHTIPTKYASFHKKVRHVFVKKHTYRSGKYKKNTYYEIWIETYEGKEMHILGDKKKFVIKNRSETQLIIEKIINFLIETELKPKSQTLSQKITKPKISARAIIKEQEISKLQIQDLKKGYLIDYKLQTWEVTAQIQYDWGQGNTDTLYRLNNSENYSVHLLVSQDLAVYQTWIEKRLTYQELLYHNLDKVRFEPPLELNFKGKELFKEHIEIGFEFVDNAEFGVKIIQYKYLSEDGKHSLRILKNEGQTISVFSGTKSENFEFSNILIS
jgi:hypothetical protein